MTKAVIFDTDGMVVVSEMFSVKFSKEYKIPYEKILPFFKNEFQPCLVGKADLKVQIKPYLKKWNWKGSPEDFLEYWFGAESNIDQRVIEMISKLKKSGIKCYLATNQEFYRTQYLKTHLGFDNIFERIFASAEVGFKKPEPEFFDFIVKKLGLEKEEVMFWDDTEKNIKGAKDFGLDARLYKNFEDFETQMSGLL